jgi:hypothetical protein
MSQSWSSLRKELEEDFICEKLKGRVQYIVKSDLSTTCWGAYFNIYIKIF